MENNHSHHLDEITKGTQIWRTKVTVISKLPWRTSQYGTRYQKLILADEKGYAIDATIFGTDIEYHENKINHDKTYIISGARVQDAVPMYKSLFANTNYSWVINQHTNVLEVQRPTSAISPFKGHFTEIGKCKQHVGDFIHTIGVVVEKLPISNPTENKILHEYVGIDRWMEPIVVSFWDDVISEERYSYLDDTDNYPTVALMDFSVSKFHGGSVASTRRSLLITALDDERFIALREWFQSHKEEAISKVNSYESLRTLRSDNFPDVTTKEILETEMIGKFFITAQTTLEDIGQNFTYICCETCHTKSEAPVNTSFRCHKCKIQKFAVRRYKFVLIATDSTGPLDITVFGRHGRKIFGMSEDKFHSTYVENSPIQQEEINNKLGLQKWRMLIKAKLYEPNEKTRKMYYNVENWPEFEDDSSPCKNKDVSDKTISEVEEAKKEAAPNKHTPPSSLSQDDQCVKVDIDSEDENITLASMITPRSNRKKQDKRKNCSDKTTMYEGNTR